MKHIRYSLIAIILIIITTSLYGCDSKTELKLFGEGTSSAVIVRGIKASEIEIEAADRLAKGIKQTAGIDDIEIYSDLIKDIDKDKIQIVVGSTDKSESIALKKTLRYDEFSIKVHKSKLLIIGGSDKATSEAVDYFLENYGKEIKSGVISADKNYTYKREYDVKNIKIGKTDLADYVIVYPKPNAADSGESFIYQYVAEKLRDHLISISGINIETVTDDKEAATNEILIGNTDRAESKEYYKKEIGIYETNVAVEGKKLVIAPGGLLSAQNAIDEITSLIDGDNLTIPSDYSYNNKDTKIKAAKEDFIYIGDDEIPVKEIKIADNDISDYTIVYHDFGEKYEGDGENEIYAAKQLQTYVKYATGLELDLKKDSEADSFGKEILIGNTNRESNGKVTVDRSNFGDEGFVIKVEGDTLIIAGGQKRGTLYGVYEFLDKYLGCRFYSDKIEVIYKKDSIKISKDLYDNQVPYMEFRDVYSYSVRNNEIASKLKINSYYQRSMTNKQGGMFKFAGGNSGFVHTMSKFLSLGPMESQPCLSDPKNLEKAIKAVRATLEMHPDSKVISVSQNDNNNYCTCSDCYRVDSEEGSHAGTLIRFVNAIADDIAKDYPDVKILTLAYMYSSDCPKTKPRDNVIIQLCSYEWCVAHPYDDPTCHINASYIKQIKDWSSVSDTLYFWDYTDNLMGNYLFVPLMNFESIYENYQMFIKYNVKGMFSQGQENEANTEFGDLRTYLLSKIMWNPTMSREEYYRYMYEFIDAYYGNASEYVKLYFDYLNSISGKYHYDLYAPLESVFNMKYLNAAKDEISSWWDNAGKLVESNKAVSTNIKNLMRGFKNIKEYK